MTYGFKKSHFIENEIFPVIVISQLHGGRSVLSRVESPVIVNLPKISSLRVEKGESSKS